MNRILAAARAAPLAALLVAPAAFPQAGRADGERLKHLFGTEARRVDPVAGLTEKPAGRLIARTGVSAASLATLRVYDADRGGDAGRARACFLDVTWRGGSGRLGAAAMPSGGQLGPRLYDDYGKPDGRLDEFLAQFRGESAVVVNNLSRQPIGAVIARRDQILQETRPPAAAEERRTWALLVHRQGMLAMERAFLALEEEAAAGAGTRAEARRLAEEVDKAHAHATHLKALLAPKEVGEYRKRLAAVTRALEPWTTGSGGESGSGGAAGGGVAAVKDACTSCHQYRSRDHEAYFQDRLRGELAAAGFGTGVFVVGVDVRPAGLEPDEAQALAGLVKAALLVAHGVDE